MPLCLLTAAMAKFTSVNTTNLVIMRKVASVAMPDWQVVYYGPVLKQRQRPEKQHQHSPTCTVLRYTLSLLGTSRLRMRALLPPPPYPVSTPVQTWQVLYIIGKTECFAAIVRVRNHILEATQRRPQSK